MKPSNQNAEKIVRAPFFSNTMLFLHENFIFCILKLTASVYKASLQIPVLLLTVALRDFIVAVEIKIFEVLQKRTKYIYEKNFKFEDSLKNW